MGVTGVPGVGKYKEYGLIPMGTAGVVGVLDEPAAEALVLAAALVDIAGEPLPVLDRCAGPGDSPLRLGSMTGSGR